MTRIIWSVLEDDKLKNLVETFGASGRWKEIGRAMESRTGKQCRERFHNHLNESKNKKGDWTKEEDDIILDLKEQFGSKWVKITSHLPGRSDHAVKNRWHLLSRQRVPPTVKTDACTDVAKPTSLDLPLFRVEGSKRKVNETEGEDKVKRKRKPSMKVPHAFDPEDPFTKSYLALTEGNLSMAHFESCSNLLALTAATERMIEESSCSNSPRSHKEQDNTQSLSTEQEERQYNIEDSIQPCSDDRIRQEYEQDNTQSLSTEQEERQYNIEDSIQPCSNDRIRQEYAHAVALMSMATETKSSPDEAYEAEVGSDDELGTMPDDACAAVTEDEDSTQSIQQDGEEVEKTPIYDHDHDQPSATDDKVDSQGNKPRIICIFDMSGCAAASSTHSSTPGAQWWIN